MGYTAWYDSLPVQDQASQYNTVLAALVASHPQLRSRTGWIERGPNTNDDPVSALEKVLACVLHSYPRIADAMHVCHGFQSTSQSRYLDPRLLIDQEQDNSSRGIYMLIFEGDQYDEREGIYVGKTSTSFKKRWKQHGSEAVNEKVARAISKNPDCIIGRHVLLDASLIPIKFWDDSLLSSLELLMNALLGATQGANMNCNIVDVCHTTWIATLTISCVQRLYDRTFAFATEHGFLPPKMLFCGLNNDGNRQQISNSVAWRAVLGDALVHEVTVTFGVQLDTAIGICLGQSWKSAYKEFGMASRMAKLQAGWDKQKQQHIRVDKIRSIAMTLASDQTNPVKDETSPTPADGMEATTFKALANPVAVTKLRSVILALDQKDETSPTPADGMEATTFKPLANPVAVTKLRSVILALDQTNPVKEEDQMQRHVY